MRVCRLLVLMTLISHSAVDRLCASTALANDPAIAWEGRAATDAAGSLRLGFPGVTAHLRFRGTELSLTAEASTDAVCFDVSVDGGSPSVLRLRQGEGTYSLFRDKDEAEHRIDLVRRTESWQGVCTLRRFDLGERGQLLSAPALPSRKLMFIGDSVTCGAMTAWSPGRERLDPLNSNARISYGMLLAKKFGAQCHLVSYGGRGALRDWQGIRDFRNAPHFYELALPDDPESQWDHRRYVPDAIGVQLGTNDFNLGAPDEIEFVNAYVELLRKVRRDAPNAYIFVMESPIVNDDVTKGPRRTTLRWYLEEIVRRMASDHVIFAPLKHAPGVPGDGHPTAQEHVSMAEELEPLFRRALGW